MKTYYKVKELNVEIKNPIINMLNQKQENRCGRIRKDLRQS